MSQGTHSRIVVSLRPLVINPTKPIAISSRNRASLNITTADNSTAIA